ncbi:MAG: hypothetical protein VKI81_08915 [Synechococcaceae cyanobacterium]|nr:hypothetical protein [Synechococcaceae cyanobacterium]
MASNHGSARPAQPRQHDGDSRRQLLDEAARCHQRAREAAEAGDLTRAAQAILEGLDCERRAGGLGPQVLQLIKPR